MKLFHWIIFVIPILLIGIVFLNKIFFGINDPFYRDLASEDNLIENLTVYAYFLAFGFLLFILKYVKKNIGIFSIFVILSRRKEDEWVKDRKTQKLKCFYC